MILGFGVLSHFSIKLNFFSPYLYSLTCLLVFSSLSPFHLGVVYYAYFTAHSAGVLVNSASQSEKISTQSHLYFSPFLLCYELSFAVCLCRLSLNLLTAADNHFCIFSTSIGSLLYVAVLLVFLSYFSEREKKIIQGKK